MSNIIPPLISSSPPPMVANLEEEDDDFGEFPLPVDVSYNCDALSLPPTPHESPKKLANGGLKTDINSNRNIVSESNKMFPKDYQDKRKTDAIKNEVNSTNNVENTPSSLSVDNIKTETQFDVPTSEEKPDLKAHTNKQDTELNKLEVPEDIYFEEPPELPPDDINDDDDDFASFSQSLELDENQDISVPFVVNQEVLKNQQDTCEPLKSEVQSDYIGDLSSVIKDDFGSFEKLKFEQFETKTELQIDEHKIVTDNFSHLNSPFVSNSVVKSNSDSYQETVTSATRSEKSQTYIDIYSSGNENKNLCNLDGFKSSIEVNCQEILNDSKNTNEPKINTNKEAFDAENKSFTISDDDFHDEIFTINDSCQETFSNESKSACKPQIITNIDNLDAQNKISNITNEDFHDFKSSSNITTFEESCRKTSSIVIESAIETNLNDFGTQNEDINIMYNDFDEFKSSAIKTLNSDEGLIKKTKNIGVKTHQVDLNIGVCEAQNEDYVTADDDFDEFKSSFVISDSCHETFLNEPENIPKTQIDADFDDFINSDEDFDDFKSSSVINATFEGSCHEMSTNVNKTHIETRVDIFGAPYEVVTVAGEDFNELKSFALIQCENTNDLDFQAKTAEHETGVVNVDFGEYDDFQTHSSAKTKESDASEIISNQFENFGSFVQNVPVDLKGETEKIEDIVVCMFPKMKGVIGDSCSLDFLKGNFIFEQMQDITETNAVSFVWSKSSSQKTLLKALNIDTRNILHGGGWNLSMPKFAANLSAAPLEPVKSEILTPTPANVSFSTPTSQSDIPTAQFDWSGSGLTNPLDCNQKEQTRRETDSVKSLQFSETEIESTGDNFGVFQASKPEMPGSTVFPLRETHISNQVDSEPGWLKPTILTPVLGRKDIEANNEEEFSDFQMGVTKEKKSETEFRVLPSIAGANVQKFAFESVLEPLKPTILQPAIINKVPAQINWPDPGLSEEELANIELSISSLKTEAKIPITAPETVEDDDWSEFVSNQEVKLKSPSKRTATPELQLCIPQLSQIQPPKQPIPVITPHGLIQTKIPSNNYHKITRNPHSVLKPLQKQPIDGYQPSIISNQFAKQTNYALPSYHTSIVSNDDDDWTDFISSQPPPTNGIKSKPQITPNIITNPHFEQNSYKPTSDIRNGVNVRLANISLPELDFVAPKTKMKQ